MAISRNTDLSPQMSRMRKFRRFRLCSFSVFGVQLSRGHQSGRLVRIATLMSIIPLVVATTSANWADTIDRWFDTVSTGELRNRLNVLTQSPDELSSSYPKLISHILDEDSIYADKDAGSRFKHESRVFLALNLLADAVREQRDNDGTKSVVSDFRTLLKGVIDRTRPSTTLTRQRALQLLSRTYIAEQFITMAGSMEEIEAFARPYVNDGDKAVRKQAAMVLMNVAIQDEEREAAIREFLTEKMKRIANDDTDFSRVIHEELLRDSLRIRYESIGEESYLRLKRMSDDELLTAIRSGQEPNSSFALEIITDSWERTTRNHAALLKLLEDKIAVHDILRAVAQPVPASASDTEKRNQDTLLVYLKSCLAGETLSCDPYVWQAVLSLFAGRMPDVYDNVNENKNSFGSTLDTLRYMLVESKCRNRQAWLVAELRLTFPPTDSTWASIDLILGELRPTLRPESEEDARLIKEIDRISDNGLAKWK